MTTSVSVPAAKLREMLEAVIPHASPDDTLPSLVAVRFEVAGGTLYVAATDRYTLAVARYPVPGAQEAPVPDAGVTLPLKAAKSLRRMLKNGQGVAALLLADETFSADAGSQSGKWAVTTSLEFPDWRATLRKMLTAPPAELGDGHGMGAEILGRFTAGADPFTRNPLRIRVTFGGTSQKFNREPEPAPVMVITRGDWFIGAAMPVRIGEYDGHGAWDDWAAVVAPAETAGPQAAMAATEAGS
jgi:hypothetical protein